MAAPRRLPVSGATAAPGARRPANLGRAVTAELVQWIVQGNHLPGTLLPPEQVLCENFAVSRTVVREAVKILQEKGLVRVRQGAGTIVTASTEWNMLDELVLAATIAEDESLALLDDLVVTRRLLESDMANVAARSARQETIDRLTSLVDQMDELVNDHVTYEEYDRIFHDTIMLASGNRIARGVVQALQSQAIHTARYVGRTEPTLCAASNRGHRSIAERIAERDSAGAAEAMFSHITEAWLVRRGGRGSRTRLRR